jgi:hypothetical protein
LSGLSCLKLPPSFQEKVSCPLQDRCLGSLVVVERWVFLSDLLYLNPALLGWFSGGFVPCRSALQSQWSLREWRNDWNCRGVNTLVDGCHRELLSGWARAQTSIQICLTLKKQVCWVRCQDRAARRQWDVVADCSAQSGFCVAYFRHSCASDIRPGSYMGQVRPPPCLFHDKDSGRWESLSVEPEMSTLCKFETSKDYEKAR